VAGLVERKLVSRKVATHDRRESRLRLSAAGRRIHDQIVPLALEHERRLLQRLNADEQAWLLRILDALAPSPETALD
jgi:DNA-binding MarR family transcriptional regulator